VVGHLNVDAPGRRRRLPYRLIYPRNGREARLWYRHRIRTSLKRRRVSLFGRRKRSGARDTGP
jgi:hypothetical protein